MSKQQYYRGGRSSQQQSNKKDEFSGYEAFKKSSSSTNNNQQQSTSKWNDSVKNQWNDPQRYVQEVSKNYERNQSNVDVFDKYKSKTIADRENDYTSKWRNVQLSPERIDPFASTRKSSSSNTTNNNSSTSTTSTSNKRSYNEIYEENKIEREKRNILYQLKKANTNQHYSTSSNNSSSSSSNNNTDDNNSDNNNVNVGINFETSGILVLQSKIVNQKGTILKWQSPPECKLTNMKWIIVEMKNDKQETKPILLYKQKAWLLGRDQDISDISLLNPSCSSQHAVICFRKIENTNNRNRYINSSNNSNQVMEDIKPFIIDLKSTNGTFINGERIDDSRYYELKNNDILTFGQSSREFILLNNDNNDIDTQ